MMSVTFQSPEVICCFTLPVPSSYMYRWPQFSRSLNHITSFDSGKYFQFTRPLPDSKNVGTFSVKTSRTPPVPMSATRTVSSRWSRDVETKATEELSELHCMSDHSPPRQATSSHKVERCCCGAICRRVVFRVRKSITTG